MAAEYIASAAALGAIGAAQLSGFGVYMAASTALSFLSMSAGIVLPFTAYTSLSATIAVAIGPLGLALAAFPAVFKFLQTKPEQLLGGIVVIAAWRSRLIAEGRMVGSETANNQRSTNRRRRWKVALVGVLVAVLVGFAALLLRPR
jgi:hypothetical protein